MPKGFADPQPQHRMHPFWRGIGLCTAERIRASSTEIPCAGHPQMLPSLELAGELIQLVNKRCADAGDVGPLAILSAAGLLASSIATVHASDHLAVRFTSWEVAMLVSLLAIAYRDQHFPALEPGSRWRFQEGLGMEQAILDAATWEAKGEHHRPGGAKRA